MSRGWPADNVERWPVTRLTENPRNAQVHPEQQIARIAASLERWGWTMPVLVDESGQLIAGHGRLAAARRLGITDVPVMVARGWTESERRAYAIADNQLPNGAEWDTGILAAELEQLEGAGFEADLLGFEPYELGELLGTADEEASPEDDSKGALLARSDITIDDPHTQVSSGEQWRLGPHTLVVCSVVEDWRQWTPLLSDDALFCPFPGPFVLASERAKERRLVLVQPDAYVAGHIIDRYIRLFGSGDVQKVAA